MGKIKATQYYNKDLGTKMIPQYKERVFHTYLSTVKNFGIKMM